METTGVKLVQTDNEGKQVVVPFPGRQSWKTWLTSRGDDLNPTPPATGRGEGTKIQVTYATSETGVKTIETEFSDPIELHDGQVSWDPAEFGPDDEFSVYVKFTATPAPVSNPGAGNCNLVAVTGGNLIVPASGDGSHDVDLDAAIPIPSSDSTGYWDANYSTGAVSAASSPGAADFDLYDFVPLEKLYMVKNVTMANPLGVFDVDVYKVEWFHKSWKFVLEVNKSAAAGAETKVGGWILAFREKPY